MSKDKSKSIIQSHEFLRVSNRNETEQSFDSKPNSRKRTVINSSTESKQFTITNRESSRLDLDLSDLHDSVIINNNGERLGSDFRSSTIG